MQQNIRKLYLINFLTGAQLWYPIEKLFYKQIGITAFGAGMVAAVYLVTTIVFDVPAGVLADRWERRKVLMLAMISLAAASFIGGISHSLQMYLGASVLVGLYAVMTSGTFQAFMYDMLKEEKEEKHYDKYQGRAYALFLAGVGVSSLAGGFIGHWYGYRSTYFLSIITTIISLYTIYALKEPRHSKVTVKKHYFAHMKKGFSALRTSPLVFHLAVFIVIAGILNSTQNEFGGLYYIALGLTAIPTGMVNATKWISRAMGQLLGHRLGRKVLKLIPLWVSFFVIFTLLHSRWGLVFFMLAALTHGMMLNQAEAEIQGHIGAEFRATTISALSFMTNVILVPVELLFGWYAGRTSVFRSYQFIAALGVVYVLVWLVRGAGAIRTMYGEPQPLLEPAADLSVTK